MNEMGAALREGLKVLSEDQAITFTKYYRLVLPLDGFVFWIKSGLAPIVDENDDTVLDPGELVTLSVRGSLHYLQNQQAKEDETITVRSVVFTATEMVTDFNDISPTELWVGEFDGFKFGFNERSQYYSQSELHHYKGDGIYPNLQTQIIDDLDQLSYTTPVLSNSTAIWLGLNKFFPIYPAYLIPSNASGMYASIYIDSNKQKAIQPIPAWDKDGDSNQLITESVRVIIYNAKHNTAVQFLNYVIEQAYFWEEFGISDASTLHDENRPQTEFNVKADKKSIIFQINYTQYAVNSTAKQLIESAYLNKEL